MLEASEALYERVTATPSSSGAEALAALWASAVSTLALVDAHADELHEKVARPVWGHISNAVERIAGSEAYQPEAHGLPSLDAVIGLLRRLSDSPFPEAEGKE